MGELPCSIIKIITTILILTSCSSLGQSKEIFITTMTTEGLIEPIITERVQLTPGVMTDFPPSTTTTFSLLSTRIPYRPPTITPDSTLTWTPVPTLAAEEARRYVRELLENNGGCKLPCWWGMVPGKTDWNKAKQHLETFVKSIEPNGEGQIIRDGIPIHWADFLVRYETDNGIEDNFNVSVENGVIEEFLVGGLRLDRLLSSYGSPDEVYISTHSVTSDGGPPPFYFLVYYEQKGFWAQYDLNGEVVGNIIKGCPQSIDPARIWLGSPENKWKKEDLWDYVFGPPIASWASRYPILTLEEAVGMDLKTFTHIFQEPNNQMCIETPAKLWD
jgi:hypothetical protein